MAIKAVHAVHAVHGECRCEVLDCMVSWLIGEEADVDHGCDKIRTYGKA